MFSEKEPSIKSEMEKLNQRDQNERNNKKELLMANIVMVEDTIRRFGGNPEYDHKVVKARALLEKYKSELLELTAE